MSQTQGDLAALSRFVFRAPDWSASLFVALFVAAVAGVAAFDYRFILDDAGQGVFYIGLPTVVAAFGTPPVDRVLGGRLTYNRSALLALISEVVLVVFLVGAAAIVTVTTLDQRFVFDVLLVGLASIFALRLFVVMAVSGRSLPVASIPASIQTAAAAVLLFLYGGTFHALGGTELVGSVIQINTAPAAFSVGGPRDFLILGAISVVYGVAVGLFVITIDRPWRRALGVSVLDFVGGFIGHVAEGSRELEDFFEALGEDAVVPVVVLAIRRPDGTEKARFVLPMIHPGPMGDIGGGNLPERVAATAEGLAFPPHATAGHDFNLVTEREVDVLLDAAGRAADRIDYHSEASRSIREQEGDSKLLGQSIGNSALIVATHAPEPADDIDFSVGLSTAAEARSAGLEEVMLVDAHNCHDGLAGGNLGHVVPGSARSFDMLTAAGRLGEQLSAAERHPLRVGVAWSETDWTPTEGIGPLGVRVAVFDAGGHRTAYVLVDGNNMESGLRERLLSAIPTDDGEVMTTDTHVVNTVDADNRVGGGIDDEELIDLVVGLVAEATDDLEVVEAGIAAEHAEVTVFGNDRTETLASTANAMIGMGGALALAVVGGAVAVSLLIFLLAS